MFCCVEGVNMPNFSKRSLTLLEQCHPDLQRVMKEVIKYFDFTVLDSTIRTEEEQKKLVKEGKSKTLNSKHLKRLVPEYGKEYSFAVDIAPYPINWDDRESFCYLAGFVLGVANYLFDQGEIGHKIKFGGDWNRNNRTSDEKFSDLPHFEIIENL